MTEYFQIELTGGQVTQVSREDWDDLSKHRWHAKKMRDEFYAVRVTAANSHPAARLLAILEDSLWPAKPLIEAQTCGPLTILGV